MSEDYKREIFKINLRYWAVGVFVILAMLAAFAFGDIKSPGKWAWFLLGIALGIAPISEFLEWIERKRFEEK